MIIQSLFGDLLSSHVGWNLDYDRTGPSVAEIVESAAHDTGDLIGLNDDLAVFGNGLKCPHRREIGPHGVLTESRASGQIQDRDVVAECLSDATHRVFRAGAALGDDYAELLPAIHAAESVGGHDCAPFMPEHDGADTLLGHLLNQIVGRKA